MYHILHVYLSCIWYFANDTSRSLTRWMGRHSAGWRANGRHVATLVRNVIWTGDRAKFRTGAVTQVGLVPHTYKGLQKQELQLVNVDPLKLQKSNSEHCRILQASFDKSTGFWWRTLQRSIRTPGWTITVSTSQWISTWRTQLHRSLPSFDSKLHWLGNR